MQRILFFNMEITILCGSSRQNSNSLKLATYLQKLLAKEVMYQVQLISFENADIPMVGRGDLKPDALSPFQQKLVDALAFAKLVFVIVPEYNWNTSGEFINALDQLGNKDFAYLFDNKVFAVAGVSSGRGGRMPSVEISLMLSKLINFLDKQSIVSPRVFESHETQLNLSSEGQSLGNPAYEKGIASFIDYALKMANRWHK